MTTIHPDEHNPMPRPLPEDLIDLQPQGLTEAKHWLRCLSARVSDLKRDARDAQDEAQSHIDELERRERSDDSAEIRDQNFVLRARMHAIRILAAQS